MAGFFDVGSEGVGCSTFTFTGIADISRAFFHSNELKYLEEIYFPYDEGGLYILSLDEQDSIGFSIFYRTYLTSNFLQAL